MCPLMTEFVVLVTPEDDVLGLMEKQQAHVEGVLHRAFSVFIFNAQGEMLLQQRAAHKYHSPQLWTNACCSHPREHESYEQAAHRRLHEELGFDCPLSHQFHFIYKAEFENGLTEHELDHVFFGTFDGNIVPNPDEVMAYKWILPQDLRDDVHQHPDNYTAWFKIILDMHPQLLNNPVTSSKD